MNVKELLKITNPCGLFPNDLDGAKSKYKEFALQFHPDINGNTPEAFQHLKELYDRVVILIQNNEWEQPNVKEVIDDKGNRFRIRYHKRYKFELGEFFVSDTVVAYFIEDKFKHNYENAVATISKLKYPTPDLKTKMIMFMPKILKMFKTKTHHVMIIEKWDDVFLLQDVLEHFKGKMEPKLVAWVLSRIHDHICFLNYNKLSSNDIRTNTYFVSVKNHFGYLFGNWWYATPIGSRLTSVPKRTFEYMPMDVKQNKVADIRTDLELLRALGREMLGDITGTRLVTLGVPEPMVNWLRLPSSGDAIQDYDIWRKKVLINSFGKREFYKTDLTKEEIYG
jgi:hypothetical protein